MRELISAVRVVAARSRTPDILARRVAPVLVECAPSVEDVGAYLDRTWDPGSCLAPPMDTPEPPFVLDVERTEHWLLRITFWPPAAESTWRDAVHDHFGYIVTTALTASAYCEDIFASFRHRKPTSRELTRGKAHIIEPSTIHRISLPASWGLSLALRTRSVRRRARERDLATGKMRTRSRATEDYKRLALGLLSRVET